MSSYGEEKVKCPFYKEETKKSIKCEGIFGRTCVHNFASSKEKKNHKEKYCDEFYFKKCILYQSVNSTYKMHQKEKEGTFAEDILLEYNQC